MRCSRSEWTEPMIYKRANRPCRSGRCIGFNNLFALSRGRTSEVSSMPPKRGHLLVTCGSSLRQPCERHLDSRTAEGRGASSLCLGA